MKPHLSTPARKTKDCAIGEANVPSVIKQGGFVIKQPTETFPPCIPPGRPKPEKSDFLHTRNCIKSMQTKYEVSKVNFDV